MDPDLEPTPDPTPFFIDFKDAKIKIFFHIFFLLLAHRHIIFKLKKCIFLPTVVGIISVRLTYV
jgi:hypothetical protein